MLIVVLLGDRYMIVLLMFYVNLLSGSVYAVSYTSQQMYTLKVGWFEATHYNSAAVMLPLSLCVFQNHPQYVLSDLAADPCTIS